jgi:hypothetical protein
MLFLLCTNEWLGSWLAIPGTSIHFKWLLLRLPALSSSPPFIAVGLAGLEGAWWSSWRPKSLQDSVSRHGWVGGSAQFLLPSCT